MISQVVTGLFADEFTRMKLVERSERLKSKNQSEKKETKSAGTIRQPP